MVTFGTLRTMAVPSSIERIKPFPPHAVELLNRVPLRPGDEHYVRDLLEQEPALLAEIIQVAIRSGRCSAGEDLNAQSIIARFNPADLAETAITISVHDYLRRAFDVPEDRGYWRYTLACAVCCAELAMASKEDRLLAYVAGLLHDIGRLALIQAYPERYANLLILANRMLEAEQPFDMLQHERMLFGFDHFSTGVWVAEIWKLPGWMRPIVGKFDDQATKEHHKLVATVRAGTRVAHSLGLGYLQAAPRMDVASILSQLPAFLVHWKALDAWGHGEEYLRSKIQLRLKWYEIPAVP